MPIVMIHEDVLQISLKTNVGVHVLVSWYTGTYVDHREKVDR